MLMYPAVNLNLSNTEVTVKKTLVVMLAIVAVAAAGCKKKEEAPQATAPGAEQPAAAPGANPHAGMKAQEIKPGAGHKGKVVETMESGGYTYVLIEENGQKVWVAAMQTPVKVGDTVEFPDSPPMINFQSKTLKRTFDKIIFAPGLAVNK
jgi:hypothetical protein